VLRYDTWIVEKEAELQKYLNDKNYGDYTRKIRTMHENADWIYDTQFEIVKKDMTMSQSGSAFFSI